MPKNTRQRSQKKQKPEKALVNAIMQYLAAKKIFAWRQNTGAIKVEDRLIRFGVLGCSDIIGLLPNGKMFAIEAKSSKGRLSLAQKSFLDAISKNGGIAIVAKKLEDIEELILRGEYD